MKISQNIFLFFLSILFINTINAQTWTSYQSPKEINELLDTGTELFMATEAGLVVMNKSTMQKTLHNTGNAGLSHNSIVAISQEPNGNIWIATKEGKIEQFDGTNFLNEMSPNHANFDPHTEIIDFKIGPNGDFWCATNDGLFHRQGTTWLYYGTAEFGSTFFEAWDLAINNAGEVYLATNEAFKFSNGVWSNIMGSSTISNYSDAEIFISSTGDVFMSGDLSKVGRFDGTQWQEYASPGGSGWKVQGFTEDTNGDIYVSTISDGIYKLTANTWVKVVDAQTQAMGDEIAYFYIDSQNKRWLNSNIKLSAMDGANVESTLISETTLETSSTLQVVEGDNGKMYFLTYSYENIAVKDAVGNWSVLAMPTDLATAWETFKDIVVLSDTDIWLCSYQGLYHYDGTTWTKPLSQICRNMMTDSQGKIYVRGDNEIYVITNGVISDYNVNNSPISSTTVTGHGVDADDNLWLSEGTTNTLRKLSTDGTWTEYTTANHPLLEGTGGEFHFDINGNIWMLKGGVGVLKFDGTNFSNPYTDNIGQMSNYEVNSIESDATGQMYFAHQYGVTTWNNGQWGEFLINDVPHVSSIHDAEIELDNAGDIWWASHNGVFALSGVAVLPVDLTNFVAEKHNENAVELTWKTASEINNDYFSIEHSTDGSKFHELSRQEGNGTTSEGQFYAYLHENLAAGQHYYRLKQVDFDGRFEYSDIVTARIKSRENDVSIMPNPTTGLIKLQTNIAIAEDTDLQIINAQGQLVFANVLSNGEANLSIDISDLPRGIYYLRMSVGGDLLTKKIIKGQ